MVSTYGSFFKELGPSQEKITKVLRDEEFQFNRTIAQGLKVFEKKAKALQDKGVNVLPAADAFLLSGSLGTKDPLTSLVLLLTSLSYEHLASSRCLSLCPLAPLF